MKILLVADLGGWCIENRCKAIKKFLPQYDFDIFAEKYKDVWLYQHAKDYDIIHFNFSYGLHRLASFIKANGKKIILTFSNQRSILNGEGGDPKILKELLGEVAAVTSVSREIVECFPEHKIAYIPNGIDEEIFSKRKKLIVGYAGSQHAVKNFGVLKQACEELDIELRTTGDIDRTQGVVMPKIAFEDMQFFYNDIDVYVHPSLSEGCNNTILEALACNVPVLMTRTGIWKDLEGYVTYIDPTVESIKAELRRFQGRSLIDEKYLWKNIIPKYGEIYERIKHGNPKSESSDVGATSGV